MSLKLGANIETLILENGLTICVKTSFKKFVTWYKGIPYKQIMDKKKNKMKNGVNKV